MTTLAATLGAVSPGAVEVAIHPHAAISQQHGFVHAADRSHWHGAPLPEGPTKRCGTMQDEFSALFEREYAPVAQWIRAADFGLPRAEAL
jgi:hypothetical protein